MTNRCTIFISHGNPEDNEIAGWLAARLTGAGYQVWIDLWHDKGHPTWEEIEQIIRTQTVRFVRLSQNRAWESRASRTKFTRPAAGPVS